MGAQHHRALGLRGAGQAAEHVDVLDDPLARDDLALEAQLGPDRLEVGLHRQLVPFGQRLAAALGDRFGGLGRDPTLHAQSGRRLTIAAEHGEALAREAGLRHVPIVGGRLALVDDQAARRAGGQGRLVLVAPAAVVGHRLAAEAAVVERRIADEDHRDLALHVELGISGVVVPLLLGRVDAVAEEDQLGVDELLGPGREAAADPGLAEGHRHRLTLAATQLHPGRALVDRHAAHADGLRPATIDARGLEADRLHGRDDVLDRLARTLAAREAPAEFVGREDPGLLAQELDAERRGVGVGLGFGRVSVGGLGRRRGDRLGRARGEQEREREGQARRVSARGHRRDDTPDRGREQGPSLRVVESFEWARLRRKIGGSCKAWSRWPRSLA